MNQLEKREQRELKFAAPVLVAAVVGIVVWVSAGDLNPPAGPVTPTMKTLTEVEPRTPVESLPGDAGALYVIDEPGSYYLTGDIWGVSGKHGIEITTNGVFTIDLAGFSLIGAVGSVDGIHVPAPSVSLTVRNGVIIYWGQWGVNAEQNWYGEFENLRVIANVHGLSVGTGAVVRACSAAGNEFAGIVAGDGCTITGSTAYQNGFSPAGARAGIYATESTITNCTAVHNYGQGIQVGSGCHVFGNTCDSNGDQTWDGAGIYVTGQDNRIEANNVTNNDRGIDVDGTGNLIIKNSASGNTGTGSPSANYDIVAGNDYGQIVSSPGAGFTNSNPWANFEY